jgi:hypothetical protein
MKLRIRGDSIRLRVTQTEVAALVKGGVVEESTGFGPNACLVYALTSGGTSSVGATLSGSRIEVSVPTDVARTWASGDSVAIEGTQDIGEGRTLRILVEKDFACLTQRAHEDDTDAFPNPNASC